MANIPPKWPTPRHLSSTAQQALAIPKEPDAYSGLRETAAWLQHIEKFNEGALESLRTAAGAEAARRLDLEGVTVYEAEPAAPLSAGTPFVYLSIHGGGLIYFGGELSRSITKLDAETSGLTTWGVDYRMPPLHPYPAALDDCLAAYTALLERRKPEQIIVGGSSAGGNLAAAMLLRAKNEGLPLPAAVVLFSPEVDLTESGDTFNTLAGVDNTLGMLQEVNRIYAEGHDLRDPYLSPLFGNLAGLPSVFLQSGTRDLFLSNTVRFHRKLRGAGVEAELHVFEAMPHSGFGPQSEEHAELVSEVRSFLLRHITKP